MYFKYFKRLMDFILSLIAIVVSSCLFLVIFIAIRLTSKGSAFFLQRRIGQHKKEFYIIKFRTMKIDTPQDIPTNLLNKPERYITQFGKFLRKTSLDELPQLINILVGDMSIVGPRPALWNQYDLIAEREKYGANDVKPGLTGWAQINGRDEIPISIKAKLDGDYVERMNLVFDLYCMVKTIGCVIRREGIKEGSMEVPKAYEESTNNWS